MWDMNLNFVQDSLPLMLTNKAALITRGSQDSESLEIKLRALSLSPLVDPLIKVTFLKGAELKLEGVQALLMTSANGVRAFVKRSKSRNLIVYAVGDGTANEAKNQGFSSVKSASGDVVALTKLVNKFVKPENGLLYHIRGSHVAGNLKQQLISHGYKYRSDILYHVTEAEGFSQHTITSFYARKIGAVLLYSPRTAKIFCKLIKAESIGGKLDSVVAFCLSESVAKNISMFVWKKKIIPDKPKQSSLLERIRQEL